MRSSGDVLTSTLEGLRHVGLYFKGLLLESNDKPTRVQESSPTSPKVKALLLTYRKYAFIQKNDVVLLLGISASRLNVLLPLLH